MVKTLIVDDSAVIRILLKEILCARFPSMFVEEAVDEEEALEKAHLHLPDIIFMDIGLGGKCSGLELTRKIRADYPKSIIIVLTIYNLPEYREAAVQSGANYFFPKEFLTQDGLLTLMESILSNLDEGVHSPGSADKTSKA